MHDASADALRTQGEVSADRLASLGRLTQLVEMVERADPPFHTRWSVRGVALATLVLVSVLLFARMPSTQIALELRLSELTFVLPTAQPITDELAVATLGVTGLRTVHVPPSAGGPVGSARATDLYLTTEVSSRRTGRASLSPIMLQAGSRVTLRKLDGPRHYRLGVSRVGSDLGISVNGPIRIVVPPDLNEVRAFGFPRRIDVEPDAQQVTFEIVSADTGDATGGLLSPLRVDSLFLFRVDRFDGAFPTVVREVSTVDSGVVYFESIDGSARPLRPGESLHFTASRGEISGWRLASDGVLLRFEGRVRGMRAGSAGIRRSLMPTVLDWLRAQHGLSLLWGTTAYVVGLFITVLGWWKQQS
jgi:hypothetical protein